MTMTEQTGESDGAPEAVDPAPVAAEAVEAEAAEVLLPAPAVPQTAVEGWAPPMVAGRDEFMALAAQARIMAASKLVPRALQDKPHDVFLVLLTGRDVGVPTTAALRLIHVIDGTPTLAPKLRLALIARSGAGRIRPHEKNGDEWAAAEVFGPDGRRLGPPVIFTWAMAQAAGLVGSKCRPSAHAPSCGCKSNWKTYPTRMLWWRAAGYAADDYFPEVGMGLYSPDELGAVTDADGEPIDVAAVEVPSGFEGRGTARAAEDGPAPDHVLAELGERLAILPTDLADEMRAGWKANATLQRYTLRNLAASKVGLVKSLLSGLEARARARGWDQEAARAAFRETGAVGDGGGGDGDGAALFAPPGAAEGPEGGGGPQEPPPGAEEGAEAPQIDADRAARIADEVRSFTKDELAAALRARGIDPAGSGDSAQRRALAVAIYRDETRA